MNIETLLKEFKKNKILFWFGIAALLVYLIDFHEEFLAGFYDVFSKIF